MPRREEKGGEGVAALRRNAFFLSNAGRWNQTVLDPPGLGEQALEQMTL